MEKEFDLVIIGGGIAGYTAAIRASQLGMHVALIEKNKLGGTCLHQGCIPTKTYLKTSKMIDDMKHANVFGIDEVQPKFSFEKIQERKNNIVEQLYRGIEYLVQKNKIKVINGTARLLGPSIFSPRAGTVSVSFEDGSSELIQNKFVLICTGSRPKPLSFLPFNHKNIISSKTPNPLSVEPCRQKWIITKYVTKSNEDFGVAYTIHELLKKQGKINSN